MVGILVDAGVIVLVLLLVLFGTWRGLYKLIFGLVSGLAAIILAFALAGTVTGLVVEKTELEKTLQESLNEQIQGVLPPEWDAQNVSLLFDAETGSLTVLHGSDEFASISEYIAQTGGTTSALSGLVESLTSNENAKNMVIPKEETEAMPTLADLVCATAIAYILIAAVAITLWIVGYFVIRLLLFLVKKLITHTYVGHFVNKLLGFVAGLAIAMILVWGALAIIRLLGTYTWIISINQVIESTMLTKLLYENNYLYNFLVDSMDLQGMIANLVASFSSLGGGQAAEEAAAFMMLPTTNGIL